MNYYFTPIFSYLIDQSTYQIIMVIKVNIVLHVLIVASLREGFSLKSVLAASKQYIFWERQLHSLSLSILKPEIFVQRRKLRLLQQLFYWVPSIIYKFYLLVLNRLQRFCWFANHQFTKLLVTFWYIMSDIRSSRLFFLVVFSLQLLRWGWIFFF